MNFIDPNQVVVYNTDFLCLYWSLFADTSIALQLIISIITYFFKFPISLYFAQDGWTIVELCRFLFIAVSFSFERIYLLFRKSRSKNK